MLQESSGGRFEECVHSAVICKGNSVTAQEIHVKSKGSQDGMDEHKVSQQVVQVKASHVGDTQYVGDMCMAILARDRSVEITA